MAEYTEHLENLGNDIDPFDGDPEDFADQLMAVAAQFRSFDEAISLFIAEHGYKGDLEDTVGKISFIEAMFNAENIPVPRNIRKWFSDKISIEKDPTGYQFCFAFHLDIDESNDFFRRVCLERGFDCHSVREAVYYYCLKNHIAYREAMTIMDRAAASFSQEAVSVNAEIPYTSIIRNEIDQMDSVENLISYLTDNRYIFAVSKVTSTEQVRTLWNDISSPGGLADQELENHYFDCVDDSTTGQKKNRKRSTWEIYKQILGLSGEKIPAIEKNRSIKTFLKDNPVLHKRAEQDFPDRIGIDHILAGRTVSAERMRKDLILLSFYSFWIKKALNKQDYFADYDDFSRCKAHMNQYLLEAEYQELYYGNPYDWIFLFCMQTEAPLSSFREFIAAVKNARHPQIQSGRSQY